ncbi:hypothetical protein DTO169E5_4017 [Paecilomyces variotii]|nr:hypothetical protein DTO169E5_4017 [Paecilomyces variotii]
MQPTASMFPTHSGEIRHDSRTENQSSNSRPNPHQWLPSPSPLTPVAETTAWAAVAVEAAAAAAAATIPIEATTRSSAALIGNPAVLDPLVEAEIDIRTTLRAFPRSDEGRLWFSTSREK